jgi:16S rRNA (guanine527-N7)-methyltransferase
MLTDLSEFGIELTDHQLEQFDTYFNLLIEWNKVMNLTAITDFDDVCKLHFVDSISGAKYFNFGERDFSLADIGTGAGFPAVPLKIVFPNLNITLIDSLNKRLNFLNEVIDKLKLNKQGSIKTLHGRAEDFCQGKNGTLRETFDIVVSRAVANMSTLSEYCLPYVKVGGTFIAYKGDKASEELDAAKSALHLLGGKLKSAEEFLLPNSDINRTICIVDKNEKTSSKYPRKAGVPSKQPL